MKKIVLVMLVLCLSSCQQKQEPGGQAGGPVVGTMPSMADTRMLEDIVKADPKNADALIRLGNTYMDSRRFQEAVGAYEKALAITPNNVDVRVDMGTCYRGIGQSPRAVEEYRKALGINPSHHNALKNLGVVLAYDLKDNAGAAQAFGKYLEVAPNAPDAAQIKQAIQELKAGAKGK
jgi:tetratricopeptide (TPR) repeat protein